MVVLGDAHYEYKSTPAFASFGEICCHNRHEVTDWLARIQAQTQEAANYHLEHSDDDGGPVAGIVHKPFDVTAMVPFAAERYYLGASVISM